MATGSVGVTDDDQQITAEKLHQGVDRALKHGVSKLRRAFSYIYAGRDRPSRMEVAGAGVAWDEEDGWGAIHRSAMGTITAFAI